MASHDVRFDRSRPTLEVADLAAALTFLTEVVGFPLAFAEGDPPTFAMVGADNAEISLVQVPRPAIPDGAACYIMIDGIDALVDRLVAANLQLDIPLTERPWGLRDIVVTVAGGGPKVAFGERVPR